jgi:hypothetical protein
MLATPHPKQRAFSRDVINPQDGHILWVPYSAIRGVSLRIQWSNRIVNSTMSKPKEILISTHKSDPSWLLAEKPKVGELQMDWLTSEDPKEEKNVLSITLA